jgi:hypothetical protein
VTSDAWNFGPSGVHPASAAQAAMTAKMKRKA